MNTCFRRPLAILSIGGGFTGLVVTLPQLAQAKQPFIYYAICLWACAIETAGIAAGILTAERSRLGAEVMSWYCLLQTPLVVPPIIVYRVFSGLSMAGEIGTQGLQWTCVLGGNWEFYFGDTGQSTYSIGVNSLVW